jgi:hypothetical protein
MGSKRLLPACTLVLFLFSGMALADEHGHGKHHDRDDDDIRYSSRRTLPGAFAGAKGYFARHHVGGELGAELIKK